MHPMIQKVAFVIDKDHQGELPSVEINMANRSYDVICTDFMKFNMQRRDDSPQWTAFFDQLDVPRELAPRKSDQTEYDWLLLAARAQNAEKMKAILNLGAKND